MTQTNYEDPRSALSERNLRLAHTRTPQQILEDIKKNQEK